MRGGGESDEAAVVGEHLEVDAGVFLGESNQIADIAQRMVLSFPSGSENLKLATWILKPTGGPVHGFVEVVVVLLGNVNPVVAELVLVLFRQRIPVANHNKGN